jgi:hypothetical protein
LAPVKHKQKIKNIFRLGCLIYATFIMLSLATLAHAQAVDQGQGSVSGLGNIFKNGIVVCGHQDSTDGTRPSDTCTIEDLFANFARFTNFMIACASIFVIYKAVDGAFSMVTANGNQQSITEAKGKLINAFYGFMLVMIAYLLITTILYGLLQLQGPRDIVNNPTNYIKSGTQAPVPSPTPGK